MAERRYIAAYTLLRLPWELRELFKDWLATNYPLKAEHVMSRMREMRGGRENDPNFGTRHRGTGLLAKLLEQRFAVACKRLGLNQDERAPLKTTLFRPPSAGGQTDLL